MDNDTFLESGALSLSNKVSIPAHEMEVAAIRAQGKGGQKVNKVSTAVHLRFNIKSSSLPPAYKEKLLQFKDHHITADGVIIIKAQTFRSQEKNKEDARQRLLVIIQQAMQVKKKRRPTKPTRGSQRRRVDRKTKQGKQKKLRGKVDY
ncbi:MAG: aminoacyl-tRNA hydrolase [Gammaproteobacteria bacterium]|nr:aminoacyl-tRNA hydrolase [Gammaproteobacteria bacterium]